MVRQAVIYTDPTGAQCDALVLHEYPHGVVNGDPDPRKVILAIASADEEAVGTHGRHVVIVGSVPHRDAAAPGDGNVGTWHEVGK